MRREIIPTILVQDRLEFVRRLGIMEGKIPAAQLDIMDGKPEWRLIRIRNGR